MKEGIIIPVLAAGYSNGKINLYHIENAEILHTLELQGEVTCMEWISQHTPEGSTWSPDPYQEDDFSTYLPKLQSLGKKYVPTQATVTRKKVRTYPSYSHSEKSN